jgi:hypothetical protein
MIVQLVWKSNTFGSYNKEPKKASGTIFVDLPIDEYPDMLTFEWEVKESWEVDELKRLQQSNRDLLDALMHLRHNAKRSGADMGLALDVVDEAIKKAVLGT